MSADVVSFISLIIATLSAAAALITLRFFPRPYLSHRVWRDDIDRDTHPTVHFQITNLGSGSAHEVRVLAHPHQPGDDIQVLRDVNTLVPDASLDLVFSLADGSNDQAWPRNEARVPLPPGGQIRAGVEVDIEICWRQAPTMNRERTKSFRIRIAANPSAWHQAAWGRWWKREAEWIGYFFTRHRHRIHSPR